MGTILNLNFLEFFSEKNGLYFVTTVQGGGYLSGGTKKFSGNFYKKNMNEVK